MPEQQILPILVAARSPNDAEHLNGILRSLGLRVHSEWGGDAETLEDALGKQPELLFFPADAPAVKLDALVRLRDLRAPSVPIIALLQETGNHDIGALMTRGARDAVAIADTGHLKAVIERELAVGRMHAQLQHYVAALDGYESRLNALLSQSVDAIAYLQDGMHLRANPAYLALFGYSTSEDIDGVPVMDLFDSASQSQLKTAIQQAAKHDKSSHDLKLEGVNVSGDNFAATVSLDPEVIDGEPCLRIAVRVSQNSPELQEQLSAREREAAALKASLDDIRHRDPLTGLYHRVYFLEQLRQIKADDKATRALALITADQFEAVEATVGAFASGRVIGQLVEIIKGSVEAGEPVARFGDETFAVVLTRPALKDIEAWAQQLCDTVAKTVFEANGGSTSMTCSIGLTEIDPLVQAELLLPQVLEASQAVSRKGGNRYLVYQPGAVDAPGGASDAGWVKRITNALRNNTLQLVQQPIASLDGADSELRDVMVQMKAGEEETIAAAKFLPVAERHQLMPAIDRWVISHVLKVLMAQRKTNQQIRLFVRISSQSLVDEKTIEWLKAILKKVPQLAPGSLIFQVEESYLDKHLKETKVFIEAMQAAKCAISIAQFGLGRNSLGVLDHLDSDFIRLSDELVSGMHTDEARHAKVSELVKKAKSQRIETIAQRVESADTIAILWQMGVHYVQGNYLQEPSAMLTGGEIAAI